MARTFAVAAVASVCAGVAGAQNAPKKILVLDFDQTQVQTNFREIFGREDVNVGRSIARFLAERLAAQPGVEVVRVSGSLPFTMDATAAAAAGRSNGADAVVAGSLVLYGSAAGTAVGARPGIGRLRVNVGRRTTVVVVSLEARLVDVGSGMMLGMVPGNAQGSRSGLAIGVEVPNLIDRTGFIDMTRDDFRRTAIGEFTDSAVTQLAHGINEMSAQIGTMAAAPTPAPAAAPSAAPVVAAAPVPSGPVVYPSGPFMYAPFTFRGTEHFRYTVTQTERGRPTTGWYTLDLAPAGPGQARMSVAGKLGDEEWSSSTTVQIGQSMQGPQMMMSFGPLMGMGPIGITLFNPASAMLWGGRQLTIGDGWTSTSGGDRLSVRVESQCSHGGQGGYLVIMRENDRVASESCIAPTVALPLRVLNADDDNDRIELVLTEYRP